jgi:hypothetical protein
MTEITQSAFAFSPLSSNRHRRARTGRIRLRSRHRRSAAGLALSGSRSKSTARIERSGGGNGADQARARSSRLCRSATPRRQADPGLQHIAHAQPPRPAGVPGNQKRRAGKRAERRRDEEGAGVSPAVDSAQRNGSGLRCCARPVWTECGCDGFPRCAPKYPGVWPLPWSSAPR